MIKSQKVLEIVKNQEFLGYAYDGAEASFELLARRSLQKFKEFYSLESFKVSDEKEKILIVNLSQFQKPESKYLLKIKNL